MKTLYNLEVGDVVSEGGIEITVLEVLTQSCLLSNYKNTTTNSWYKFKELENLGYTVKPKAEEKWVPEYGTTYYFADITNPGKYNLSVWFNYKYDKHRLAYNLVFKTKEEVIARTDEILDKIK